MTNPAPDPLNPWAHTDEPELAANTGVRPGPPVLPPPVLPPAPADGQTFDDVLAALDTPEA